LLCRSPSPEPIYNQEGKRLNTREFRTRKKLEEERHNLVQRVLKANPEYKPPQDYRYRFNFAVHQFSSEPFIPPPAPLVPGANPLEGDGFLLSSK